MTDRYQDFVQSPIGRFLAKNLGLPAPVHLTRYAAGEPTLSSPQHRPGHERIPLGVPPQRDGSGQPQVLR